MTKTTQAKPCQMRQYMFRGDARKAIKSRRLPGMFKYFLCPRCGRYHIAKKAGN